MNASIIVPAFNEEKAIKHCLQTLLKELPKAEIILVDDGSTDNTLKEASKIAEKNKNVKIFSYPDNKGKGFAVRKGMKKAGEEIIVLFDADCCVDSKEIKKFVSVIEKNKKAFANGNRLNSMEKHAMPKLNFLGNRFFAIALSVLLRQKISDALCGTKAFHSSYLKKMNLKQNSWPDFELLFQAKQAGLEIVNVPVHYKKRKHGESKMRAFRHGFYFCIELKRIALNLILGR